LFADYFLDPLENLPADVFVSFLLNFYWRISGLECEKLRKCVCLLLFRNHFSRVCTHRLTSLTYSADNLIKLHLYCSHWCDEADARPMMSVVDTENISLSTKKSNSCLTFSLHAADMQFRHPRWRHATHSQIRNFSVFSVKTMHFCRLSVGISVFIRQF